MTPELAPTLSAIADDVAAGRTSAAALLERTEQEQARWENAKTPLHAFLSFGGDAAR